MPDSHNSSHPQEPDWSAIRADFPAVERFSYFLSASGGPIPYSVYRRMERYYKETLEFGDTTWDDNLEEREAARRKVASLINAEPDEIEFVPSTAFAMNIVAGLLSEQGQAISPRLEFPDTTLPWIHRRSDAIRWVDPEPDGSVPAAKMLGHCDSQTRFLLTSHVQFSNGFRQQLEQLGGAKQDHLLIVNATQSLGAFQIDVRQMGIDVLVCNSYKWLLAGYGGGILYMSRDLLQKYRGAPWVSWLSVQDHAAMRNDRYQLLESASRFSCGSPAFPGILALGASIDYLIGIGPPHIERRILELNRYLTASLSKAGLTILSPLGCEAHRSNQTLVHLDDPGATIAQLRKLGILCTEKPQGMRIATHFFNSEEEIDTLVQSLRGFS